ncbi:hypothetical protein EAO71_35710 [Streptomyces sp. ms191]|uniref:hypothetical protein n=1 Tax=Streptomyces sp. ms191 TaxID=1827978 RepID=UPI0011CDDF0E|nr:hypothetical protein [Streptomyces sp. ms191]TXS13385.1 hypothetical protein EAO71_35710 [Streptomyces sp. ms191]
MSAREELLAEARRLLWQGWEQSSEEIGSAAASTLMGLGMLVPQGGAAELERLRSLLNAQPAELTEAQLDALAAAGNRALNDHYHADLCFCRDWPESCASSGNYFMGTWDTAAFDIGLGAVLGLWESMRADAAAAEVAALRARVAELEAERHSTNEALSDAADQVAALESELGGAMARVAELEPAAAEQNKAIVLWLLKKAREYRSTRSRQHQFQAEAIERMADKISRGAVRPAPFVPHRPTFGELAEQRHLMDPLDHTLEALAPRTTDVSPQVQQLRDLLAGQRAAVETPLPHPTDAGSAL